MAAPVIIRVAQDGSGDYRTVQEAIDSVPLCNTRRTVIRLSPGIYRQPVYVPKTKNLITLAGLNPEDTLLTWNNTATKIDHHQVHPVLLLPTWVLDTWKLFCGWIYLFVYFSFSYLGLGRHLVWLVLGLLGVGAL